MEQRPGRTAADVAEEAGADEVDDELEVAPERLQDQDLLRVRRELGRKRRLRPLAARYRADGSILG